MENCIFCKIIAGEIPSTKIYEDNELIAILDITQTTKGHTLVIPKAHSRNLLAMESEPAGQLFSKIPGIASQIVKNLGASGMNILQNNEEIAGQTVFHTHVHLIPRYTEDDGFSASFTEHHYDLTAIADEIKGA
ncbi:HIT family protein [Lactococcus termiticola]|uniref:Histidine triad protein HIT n=1 Tax=Lactococcus termiticola TaxID=2169526 RepID=A0A2R5HD29_9LACT|nr:HIT family protein [Lactococcus termiticola]GBG95989.1 histidine triad protein HIT [Lactococcus termiticola]